MAARSNVQIERALQQEVLLRLRAWPVLAIPVPNSMYMPGVDKALIARIIGSMKRSGMLVPGAADLILCWSVGCACVELKRPATRDLLTKRPKGVLNDEQQAFRARCEALGINYAVVTSWADLEWHLGEWGIARRGVVEIPHEGVVT